MPCGPRWSRCCPSVRHIHSDVTVHGSPTATPWRRSSSCWDPRQNLWARSARQMLLEGCGLVEPAAAQRRAQVYMLAPQGPQPLLRLRSTILEHDSRRFGDQRNCLQSQAKLAFGHGHVPTDSGEEARGCGPAAGGMRWTQLGSVRAPRRIADFASGSALVSSTSSGGRDSWRATMRRASTGPGFPWTGR